MSKRVKGTRHKRRGIHAPSRIPGTPGHYVYSYGSEGETLRVRVHTKIDDAPTHQELKRIRTRAAFSDDKEYLRLAKGYRTRNDWPTLRKYMVDHGHRAPYRRGVFA